MYSGQAYGIFNGDLMFYFGGFDARDRVASIDVKKCPIYFLTGEYDWSTTPDMSEATAKKIKGANFKAMKNLGHFPATEDPQKFVSGARPFSPRVRKPPSPEERGEGVCGVPVLGTYESVDSTRQGKLICHDCCRCHTSLTQSNGSSRLVRSKGSCS
jgi:hypothetical protein